MKHKYHLKGLDRKAIRKAGMKPLPLMNFNPGSEEFKPTIDLMVDGYKKCQTLPPKTK